VVQMVSRARVPGGARVRCVAIALPRDAVPMCPRTVFSTTSSRAICAALSVTNDLHALQRIARVTERDPGVVFVKTSCGAACPGVRYSLDP